MTIRELETALEDLRSDLSAMAYSSPVKYLTVAIQMVRATRCEIELVDAERTA